MKPTLLILAAGMGSRYGGLKQIDPVGPNGESIMDYSIYDALRTGFGKVVFVVRESFGDRFRDHVAAKLGSAVETTLVFQEPSAEIGEFQLPHGRKRPWGTGHAILVARQAIDGTFAVINADDYYGVESFQVMADFLRNPVAKPFEHAMVGFRLRNTLSPFGSVSRAVCDCDERGFLRGIVEWPAIEQYGNDGRLACGAGASQELSGNDWVSMNLWGFQPSIFQHFSQGFSHFLEESGTSTKAEFYISLVIDDLIKSRKAAVRILPTDEKWFGMTYQEDKTLAQKQIAKLIDDGVYPPRLWQN